MAWLVSVLVAMAVILGPAKVHAAGQEACIVYSNQAVRAAKEASDLRCGFSGPAWSPNPSAHMRWCRGVNDESIAHETSERKNALGNCADCRKYAADAAEDANKAVSYQCGFSGPRWQTDATGHFRWCMRLNDKPNGYHNIRSPAVGEWLERQKQIDQCAACRRYADEAVRSAKQNVAGRCGFGGPRWLTNGQAHFNWCMKFGRGAADDEANRRFVELRECGEKRIRQGIRHPFQPGDLKATPKAVR